MATKIRLGELLVQQDIVSQEIINDALRVQVGGNRRLGHILIQMGALSDDQLANTLSQQLDIPLIDIDEVFTTNVKHLLPRYLCTKYSALPLALQTNNVMLTAMANPSDQEAIKDIEHYTGKVVEPCLARQSDVVRAIPKKVPYSIQDIFNPQNSIRLNRTIATIALALVVILGVSTYNYMQTAKYGTVSELDSSTLYEHHDLMVGFDNSGKITFLGHSAFSDGYYSVSFYDLHTLKAFIQSRKDDFSAEQAKWLKWVLIKEKSHDSSNSIIAKNER